MNIARTLMATTFPLCLTLTSLAQQSLIPAPGKDQISIKKWETLHYRPSAPSGSAAEKPTGPRQRLIRTEHEAGQPPNPMVTSNKMVYSYSGYHGSSTGIYGLEPFSAYDTGYSLMNGSYAYLRLHPSGSLKYSFTYRDLSAGSGPGATQKTAYEYDTKNRLLLDSFAQTGQPGMNLDWKYRYAYDNQDRLIYADYTFNGYDGGFDDRLASWKFYTGNDTVPRSDSVIVLEDNVTTIKTVRHYYNSAQQLIADSTYIAGPITSVPLEVTHYTYLAGGKRVAVLSKWINNVWSLYQRVEQTRDHLGRETFLQFEYFENGIWWKYVRRERQYTYDTQTELIPTVETSYNGFTGDWAAISKDVRTFRNDLHVDTLYSYVSSTGYIDGTTIPSFFAYQYNDYGNLTQAYKHYFLEGTGQEISGYLINYFYEDYNDPTAIDHRTKGTLDFKAYPNPARAQLHLSTAEAKAALFLRITDIGGVCRMQQRLNQTESDLDIRQLAPGMYFISLTDKRSGQYGVSRFVKQ